MKRTEILAPVGNKEMALAAIHSGADAIYMGTPGFNARGRSKEHTEKELKDIIDLCHLYGVKVLLALNVLIFERELAVLKHKLPEWIALNPDAFIVQDLGLAKLIRSIAPEMTLHGSTQMTTSSAEAIEALEELGIKRFVLSREMSLEEIRKVREQTEKELEVFVHGALCVSYSGQCLTSEAFGGRSANRGQCAQSCRLDYQLLVDGELFKLPNEKRYLFSPKDLCGLEEAKDLQTMGIDTLKIEGRLKTPQYVSSTVKEFHKSLAGEKTTKDILEQTYSRGFYSGWLQGVAHQELVDGVNSANIGLFLGTIETLEEKTLWIRSNFPLEKGMGISAKNDSHTEECAGKIWELERKGAFWGLRFANDFPFHQLETGWKVWQNSNPNLDKQLALGWTDRTQFKRLPLELKIEQRGKEIHFTLGDLEGNEVTGSLPFEVAQKKGLNEETVQKEFSKLADTAFSLFKVDFALEKEAFVPSSLLRKLRQDLVEKIQQLRRSRRTPKMLPASPLPSSSQKTESPIKLNLLVRKEAQLDLLAGLPIDTILMDFEFGKDYKPGLEKIRSMGYKAGIATLRVFKPGEERHTKLMNYLKPDVFLVRNLGAYVHLKDSGIPMIGDYSLNITNSLSASFYEKKGFQTLTPSFDLNHLQLEDLFAQYGGAPFEVLLHHYMPTFHMEHCVFAAFLSEGNSWRDCGKPCEKHQVEVRDHKGAIHYLAPDQECRNTMFNGTPQSALKLLTTFKEYGVHRMRIEALNENAEQLRRKVELYASVLQNPSLLEEVHTQIGVEEKYGVAEGQLFNLTEYIDRKKN